MRIFSLTIRGFRSFGAAAQTLECEGPLAVVFGSNSHGKSSLVEAIEFLLTGQTTRAQLHSGSKSEFANCLRNVHLPSEEEVFVEADLEIDGTRRRLRRVLMTDIDQGGLCKNSLFIDDKPAPDISSAGIRLATPPFQSPVLMQHALRFVLSSAPQSRTDYLKAVLDVGDLDEIHRVLGEEISGLPAPSFRTLELLEQCRGNPKFGVFLATGDAESAEKIAEGLVGAVRSLLLSAPPGADLPLLAEHLRAELDAKQKTVFPLAAMVVRPPPVVVWPKFEALRQYAQIRGGGAATAPPLLDLLDAVLRTPGILDGQHPVDCPVCLTPEALTSERLNDIQEFLNRRKVEQSVLQQAQGELSSAIASGKLLREFLNTEPAFLGWTEAERLRLLGVAEALVPPNGEDLFAGLIESVPLLKQAWSAASSALDVTSAEVKRVQDSLRSGTAYDAATLIASTGQVTEAVRSLGNTIAEYHTSAAHRLAPLRTAVEQRAETRGWPDLLALCGVYKEIPDELRRRKTHERMQKETQAALKQIDRARKAVLDENFSGLSNEVLRWWELLRPEEPIRFAGLRRRGAGLRFVDLKASLSDGIGGTEVERDAAGVFSDSQLNALGLAVFLARAVEDNTGLIVLDDPVPASDAEHRATFANKLLGHLLASTKLQTIVTTHDRGLSKAIHDYHDHAGIDGYEIAMEPGGGSVLIRRSDDLRSLLDEAAIAVEHSLDTQLGDVSDKVRKAAERLAKEVVVLNRRAAGDQISVAEITGNLKELVAMATPFLKKDNSHPGKLKAAGTLLNPGSHDDVRTPSRQDLKTVLGDLKALRKTYCKRLADQAT